MSTFCTRDVAVALLSDAAIEAMLQRILLASAPLQRMMLDEKSGLLPSIPALCQALCILLAGQAQVEFFVHVMIRSALLVKVSALVSGLGDESEVFQGCLI
jgi:hypothetical protein